MGQEYFWWGPMWFFPMIMPIVLVVIIFICLYFMFGRGLPAKPWEAYPGRDYESALEILKKRYAKGEINREEFEQMKKDILT